MKRRDLLAAAAASIAGFTTRARSDSPTFREPTKKLGIPLVHITDLYHPPQDPDDHIDLATVAALNEYDLRAVILDTTRKFLLAAPAGFDIQREPGFIPVVQLGYILGRSIPVAMGPTLPLARPGDDVADRPSREQAGVRLLLDVLEDSREEVVVSVVGSARVLTAACNRSPALIRKKVRSVLLNAGSTAGPKREWNVGLDSEAHVGLWRSGLPIHWYPCATESGAFNPDHERGTYWKSTHAILFHDLAPSLRSWFTFALSADKRGDFIAALGEGERTELWDRILGEQRNMWATASLVMGAGRVLAKTSQGWRFVPSTSVGRDRVWNWRLDRIDADVNPMAEVQWRLVKEGGNAFLFGRERGPEFGGAMAEALGALLAAVRVG